MADRAQYEELIRQFGALSAVKRELGRILPDDCSSGSAAVLGLLGRHGDMRMSRLAELLAVDLSVTSRQVAYVASRGWIDRSPDPADRRSRILSLTPAGRARLDEMSERTVRLIARRLSDWSDDDVGRLAGLMARLRASFDDTWLQETPAVHQQAAPAPEPVRPVHEQSRPPAAPSADERRTRTPATHNVNEGSPWQRPHQPVCGLTPSTGQAPPTGT